MAALIHRLIPLSTVFVVIIAGAVTLAQQPNRRIGKIEVEGLEKLTADEVIATTGLKTGAEFLIPKLDAAGQKLADSGLFAKVGYRTSTKGNLVTIVFQVEESKSGKSPVVFDNFVWFTNDQLNAAIKREVPSFDGTASDSGNMTDSISRALQNLLKENHIEGTVEYAPEQNKLNGNKQEHLFSVSGVPIPICKLHFPGAKNVSEEKLVLASKQLTDADYSLKSAIAFGNFVLFPIYREAGQLRARFATPVSKYEGADNCKGGVELSIPVEEGPVYRWNKPEWSGNEVLSPAELDAALSMKPDEIANGVKFDKGLIEVVKKYSHTGHLNVGFDPRPEFDDAASRVTYKTAVKEGPQYRMGKFTVKGLSPEDAKSLEAKWKLESGAVFDSSYSNRFFSTDAREEFQRIFSARKAQGKGPPQSRFHVVPNRQTLTADVVLEFKN
jgi:outer membrane protein assembly factor BamA